jgi:hypothetical protein
VHTQINLHQQRGLFTRPDLLNETLYVITPVFNAPRYRSRWALSRKFEKYVTTNDHCHLIIVELVFGQRERVFVDPIADNETIITLYTTDELWYKENMINIAIQHLTQKFPDWRKVAWIDGDIQFSREDWAGETLQQLEHYQWIQMFSQAVDLAPNFEILNTHRSFMWAYQNDAQQIPEQMPAGDYYYGEGTPKWSNFYKHPGFAWAARRESLDAVGGLIDFTVVGGGDMFMAYCLTGALSQRTMPASLGPIGIKWLERWQTNSLEYIKKNVGYLDGLLLHYWHGKKADRKYNDRGQILVDAEFNPETDLKKDVQGLYQLNPKNIKLRDGIRKYSRQRNEDSIDL